MFSYRHGFHAGNHADVLKHLILIECIRYLQKKDTGLLLVDTHAGAGIYELNTGFATISKEANEGILKLHSEFQQQQLNDDMISKYLREIRSFNTPKDKIQIYPGSPALFAKQLRPQDRLKLFELHTSDLPLLEQNIRNLHVHRQTQVFYTDGFDSLKGLLPPPSRRGLILMDPSYEDKNDYVRVLETVRTSIKKFPTGTYLIWYPYLSRIDSQELPERLKNLSKDGPDFSWLHARLTIKPLGQADGLVSSGIFIINPPWTLNDNLEKTLPILCECLSGEFKPEFLLENHAL